MPTKIKKTGDKQLGIILFAFIVEKISKHMVTRIENFVPEGVHVITDLVRIKRKLDLKQEKRLNVVNSN